MAESAEPSGWKDIRDSWREAEAEKAPVLACWASVKDTTILSALRDMYRAYKQQYRDQEWEWVDEEAAVRVRLVRRAQDDKRIFHYYELGLGATKRGVMLWCSLDLSPELWSMLEPSGQEIWPREIAEFSFKTIVDVPLLTVDDLARCFQHLLAGRGRGRNVPRIDGVRPFADRAVAEAERCFKSAEEAVRGSESRQQADALRTRLGIPVHRVGTGDEGKSAVLVEEAREALDWAQRNIEEGHFLEAISLAERGAGQARKAQEAVEHEYTRVHALGVSYGAHALITAAALGIVNAINGAIAGAILPVRASILGAVLGLIAGAMVLALPARRRRAVFFLKARTGPVGKLKALMKETRSIVALRHPETSVFRGALWGLGGLVLFFFIGFWAAVFADSVSPWPVTLLWMRIGAGSAWLIGVLTDGWLLDAMGLRPFGSH
jgi:hypothetical protein